MQMIVAKCDDSSLVLMIYDTDPGWKIVAERLVENKWVLISDRWEERLEDIPRYISDYTNEEVVWSDANTGEVVRLEQFISEYG